MHWDWHLSSCINFLLCIVKKTSYSLFPWLLGLLGIHDIPSRKWEAIRQIMTFPSKNIWWCNFTYVWKKEHSYRSIQNSILSFYRSLQVWSFFFFYGWYETQSLIYRWDASWMFRVGDSWHHTTCVALHELFTAGEIKADLCQWHKQQTRKAVLHNKTMNNNFVLPSPAKSCPMT